MIDYTIRTKADLIRAVEELGILPYFCGSIPGFSIEEHVGKEAWFDSEEGIWEWKGPVIRETGCAYGKFFDKKAAFVSKEWFDDLANYRRDGYDFDARFEDELASYQDKYLFELVEANGPILSKDLKKLGDYRKDGRKGFDTVIGRLQFQCYVVISDFVYLKDKHGQKYGWGVAEYAIPEVSMGKSFASSVYQRKPAESYRRLFDHIKKICPQATEEQIRRFLK